MIGEIKTAVGNFPSMQISEEKEIVAITMRDEQAEQGWKGLNDVEFKEGEAYVGHILPLFQQCIN